MLYGIRSTSPTSSTRCCASITQRFWKHSQDRPGGLAYPDACAVLAIASTPTQAARLTYSRLNAALRREDRQRGVSCLHSAAASVELAPDLSDPAPDATGCAPSSDPARSFPTRIEWHLHAVPSSASGSAPQVFVIDSSRRVSLPRSTRVPLGPTRRTFSSDP